MKLLSGLVIEPYVCYGREKYCKSWWRQCPRAAHVKYFEGYTVDQFFVEIRHNEYYSVMLY